MQIWMETGMDEGENGRCRARGGYLSSGETLNGSFQTCPFARETMNRKKNVFCFLAFGDEGRETDGCRIGTSFGRLSKIGTWNEGKCRCEKTAATSQQKLHSAFRISKGLCRTDSEWNLCRKRQWPGNDRNGRGCWQCVRFETPTNSRAKDSQNPFQTLSGTLQGQLRGWAEGGRAWC